jgi:hypothetical protein
MREIIIEQVCRIRPHLNAAALAHVSDESLLRLLSVHAANDRRHRYQARLMIDGNRVSLGYFKTPEEARAAVDEAKFRHSIGLPLTV